LRNCGPFNYPKYGESQVKDGKKPGENGQNTAKVVVVNSAYLMHCAVQTSATSQLVTFVFHHTVNSSKVNTYNAQQSHPMPDR